MNCSNCLKEIPDGAKSCSYCEEKQNRESSDPRAIEEVKELMDSIDPQIKPALGELAGASDTAEDFVNAVMGGPCPACGSPKTENCDEVRGIDNILVDRCIKCGTLFCDDCRHIFKDDVVTISSPDCPACGSSNTDYPMEEDDNWGMMGGVVTCGDCGVSYCFSCGTPPIEDGPSKGESAGQNGS